MKKQQLISSFSVLLAFMLVATCSWAQMDKSKRPSPPATAKGMIAGANITIAYSSPRVTSPQGVDRTGKIWGELVPYDKFWRAGANEATTFTTDKDISVGGKTLPKGTYTLFMKPGKDEWTVLFNSETGQWGIKRGGVANFDPANNVLEVNVKPEKAPKFTENLTYDIMDNGFSLTWENMKVTVPVK